MSYRAHIKVKGWHDPGAVLTDMRNVQRRL